MYTKRIIGVKVVAFFLIVYFTWSLLIGVCSLLTGEYRLKLDFTFASRVLYDRIFQILLSALFMIGSLGLYLVKSWARKLAVYMSLSYVMWLLIRIIYLFPVTKRFLEQSIPKFVLPHSTEVYGYVVYIVMITPLICIFIAIFYYLTRPKVKRAFMQQKSDEAKS